MNQEEIKKIAELARLELTESEIENYTKDFSGILKMIDQIKELNISNEIVRDFKIKNIMREDEINFISDTRKNILKEFPQKNQEDYLQTQKILNN